MPDSTPQPTPQEQPPQVAAQAAQAQQAPAPAARVAQASPKGAVDLGILKYSESGEGVIRLQRKDGK